MAGVAGLYDDAVLAAMHGVFERVEAEFAFLFFRVMAGGAFCLKDRSDARCIECCGRRCRYVGVCEDCARRFDCWLDFRRRGRHMKQRTQTIRHMARHERFAMRELSTLVAGPDQESERCKKSNSIDIRVPEAQEAAEKQGNGERE